MPLEEINFGITMSLCFWLFRGEACGLVKMWPRGEIRARCWSGIRHCKWRSQFWGWNKVVPVCGVLNLSNSYSTGIPWSKKKIDARDPKLDRFPHVSMLLLLLLLLKKRQWGVCTGRSCSAKKNCVWQLIQFLLPGKEVLVE